jgi:hypothetical protein
MDQLNWANSNTSPLPGGTAPPPQAPLPLEIQQLIRQLLLQRQAGELGMGGLEELDNLQRVPPGMSQEDVQLPPLASPQAIPPQGLMPPQSIQGMPPAGFQEMVPGQRLSRGAAPPQLAPRRRVPGY